MNLLTKMVVDAVKEAKPRIYTSQPMPESYSKVFGRSFFCKDFYTQMQEAFKNSLIPRNRNVH